MSAYIDDKIVFGTRIHVLYVHSVVLQNCKAFRVRVRASLRDLQCVANVFGVLAWRDFDDTS